MSRSLRPGAAGGAGAPRRGITCPLHHAWQYAVNTGAAGRGEAEYIAGQRIAPLENQVPRCGVLRSLGKTHLGSSQGGLVSVRGVLQVHSAPPAMCPHIEWAAAGVLGMAVSLPWVGQPAAPGALRAE